LLPFVASGEVHIVKRIRHKKLFSHIRSKAGRLAKTITVSFYPEHLRALRVRASELNISKSILLQLLLEIEFRDGVLRRELIARLTKPQAKGQNEPA
jgi:hypothetical protein